MWQTQTMSPWLLHITGWIIHQVQRWQAAIRNNLSSFKNLHRWVFLPIHWDKLTQTLVTFTLTWRSECSAVLHELSKLRRENVQAEYFTDTYHWMDTHSLSCNPPKQTLFFLNNNFLLLTEQSYDCNLERRSKIQSSVCSVYLWVTTFFSQGKIFVLTTWHFILFFFF